MLVGKDVIGFGIEQLTMFYPDFDRFIEKKGIETVVDAWYNMFKSMEYDYDLSEQDFKQSINELIRFNNKIDGWYIQLNYLVSSKKTEDIKVQVSNNTCFQQVGEATSSFQEVSALKEYIKCLKKEIEVLKKEKDKKEINCDDNFETFYQAYPRKIGKVNVEKWFNKNKPDEELMNKILTSLEEHKKLKQWQDKQFIPYPATWLNQKRWEDELDTNLKVENKERRYNNVGW